MSSFYLYINLFASYLKLQQLAIIQYNRVKDTMDSIIKKNSNNPMLSDRPFSKTLLQNQAPFNHSLQLSHLDWHFKGISLFGVQQKQYWTFSSLHQI